MEAAIYLLILFHTMATLVFGYILREMDGREVLHEENYYFMYVVITLELIATLALLSLVLDNIIK